MTGFQTCALPILQHETARQAITVPGVLVGRGLAVIEDDGTGWEWKLVGKVEIVDASGRRWPAKVARLLTRASAYVFETEGAEPPAPPAWRSDFKLGAGERVLSASLLADPADPNRWFVSCAGALLPFDSSPASADRLTFAGRSQGESGSGASPGVFFDAGGRPACVALQSVRLDNDAPAAWRPAEMLESGSVAWADVEKVQARVSAETRRVSYKVRFEFRVDKDDEEEPGGMAARFHPRGLYGGDSGPQDAEAFGVSIGGGRIFIPRMLDGQSVRMLEKVAVKVGDEWRPAVFAGAFRGLVGMLVEVPGARLEELSGFLDTKGVPAMTPFVYCQAEELLGEVRAEARTVRYLAMHRGHGDRLRPNAHWVPPGALLFDLKGSLAGMAVSERAEPTLFQLAGSNGLGGYGDGEMTLSGFSAHRELFSDPTRAFEPSWRPMTRQEQRRLCWLGVEFEPVAEELAERLGCSRETRGGQVGLIVSTVYPGSPAEKLGIRAQDILLRLGVDGLGEPVPLMARYAGATDAWGRSAMLGRMGAMAGMGGMGRTWKPRANFLTRLLTEAGPGRKAHVTFLASADRKVKTGSFEVGWAPEDYDSAERLKDEKLGLAVKPITYEVRTALGLKPEDPGVIVSWVEQGSSAQVARLAPFTLVLGVDGRPAGSTAEFAKAVEDARKQKKDSVRLQVSVMGKCRFADLKLGE